LAVTEDNWENFVKAIKKAGDEIPEEEFSNESLIPLDCSIGDINEETLEILSKYGPFGNGNPEPIFMAEISEIKIEREMKGGLHFKATIKDEDGNSATGLFFNVDKEEFLKKVNEEEEYTIAFYPSLKYDLKTDKFSHELICSLS